MKSLLLGCALALAAVSACAESVVSITLQPRAEVGSSAVTLGDIAQLSSPNLAVLERLISLPVGQAPRVGDSVLLTRASLQNWIKTRTRIRAEQIEWRGTASTLVVSSPRELDSRALVHPAQQALSQWVAARATRYKVNPQDVHAFAVPPGRVDLKVRPLGDTETVRSRMQVWVEVWVEGKFIRVVPVSFAVEAYGPGLVARAPAQPGQSLAPADFSTVEVSLLGWPVAKAASGEGAVRARTRLPAGAVVAAHQIEPSPAVSRGGSARLLTVNGAVRVESKVDVLQDGATGQIVRVRLASGQGPVTARVIGDGVVEVVN